MWHRNCKEIVLISRLQGDHFLKEKHVKTLYMIKQLKSLISICFILLISFGCPKNGARRSGSMEFETFSKSKDSNSNFKNTNSITQHLPSTTTFTPRPKLNLNDETNKDYFLYRVSKNNKFSYMLGTMHAGLSPNYFSSKITELFDQCQTVLFEADQEIYNKNYQSEFETRVYYPEGDSLQNHLTVSALKVLFEIFTTDSIRTQLLKLKPHGVLQFINYLVQKELEDITQVSWDFQNAIDTKLLNLAKSDNSKSIILLDDLSVKLDNDEVAFGDKELEQLLTDSIHPIQKGIRCGQLAQEAYLSGKIENFDNNYQKVCETESFLRIMNQRSQHWLPALTSAFSTGNACAAFGVGHLDGEDGVLLGLQREGFEINKITLNELIKNN